MYIPSTQREQQEMLQSLGLQSFDQLFSSLPENIKLNRPLNLPKAKAELEVVREITGVAAKNKVYQHIFRGAGAYRHFIPSVVDHLAGRAEFVTAYTPYQAEMSQGILQSIFEYQTIVCELTGLSVSNASVYDGATAAAEACIMVKDRKRNTILISEGAHPQVVEVIKTYIEPLSMQIKIVTLAEDGKTDMDDLASKLTPEVAGVYVQQPNYFGLIEDVEGVAALVHQRGAKLIAGINPIGASILKSPGECGADIAVGEGQPLGIPMAFGGPYIGFMACTTELMRKLPGRIVGQTTDAEGKRAFVLTLQAREQHIRREKAGSNICSNQALCALRTAMYVSSLGKEGLCEVANSCYANAHYLADRLQTLGFERTYSSEFFHEFVTKTPKSATLINQHLSKHNILGGMALGENEMLWCATELCGKSEIDTLIDALAEVV